MSRVSHFENMYHVIRHKMLEYLSLSDMLSLLPVLEPQDPHALHDAKFAAGKKYQNLRLMDHFESLLDAHYFASFMRILDNKIEYLEIEFPNNTDSMTKTDMVLQFIDRLDVLKNIRLIGFPTAYEIVMPQFVRAVTNTTTTTTTTTRISNITTASLINVPTVSALRFLYNYRHLENLNIFSVGDPDDPSDCEEYWRVFFYRNKYLQSVWLPDDYGHNLGMISPMVHTLRLYVHSNPRNLVSLANLTRLRIDCHLQSTGVAMELLNEYRKVYSERLQELDLRCDFNHVIKVNDVDADVFTILQTFVNLVLLIIVHHGNTPAVEQFENRIDSFPPNLSELKCYGFNITRNVLTSFVRREPLRMLDVYCCTLTDLPVGDIINLLENERSGKPQLDILMDRNTAEAMWSTPEQEYYHGVRPQLIKFLNVRHAKFDAKQGLNIRIEFNGLEEPKYWHCYNNYLDPSTFHQP